MGDRKKVLPPYQAHVNNQMATSDFDMSLSIPMISKLAVLGLVIFFSSTSMLTLMLLLGSSVKTIK